MKCPYNYHGCNGPVLAVVEHVKVFSLEVANNAGEYDDGNPDHEESVVWWPNNGDLYAMHQNHNI